VSNTDAGAPPPVLFLAVPSATGATPADIVLQFDPQAGTGCGRVRCRT
jgi:hypothetical protein